MKTFREIIDCCGRPDDIAAAIGARPETVRKWRQRSSIPAEYWTRIAALPEAKQAGVTVESMASVAAMAACVHFSAAHFGPRTTRRAES